VIIEDENIPQGTVLIPRSMGIPIDRPSEFELRIAEAALG
jgi:hypothetical protein